MSKPKKNYDDHLAERRGQKGYQSSRYWTSDPHGIGLPGEKAGSDYFKYPLDLTNRPGGDGGTDRWLLLNVNGKNRWYRMHIKTRAFGGRRALVSVYTKKNNEYVKNIIYPNDIFVFAIANEEKTNADLLGWEWGSEVLTWEIWTPYGHGSECYSSTKPASGHRRMDELLSRYIDSKDSSFKPPSSSG